MLVVPRYKSYLAFLSELSEYGVSHGHSVMVVCEGVPDNQLSHRGVAGAFCPSSDPDIRVGAQPSPRIEFIRLQLPRGVSPYSHIKAAKILRGIMDNWTPDLVHAHFSAAVFTVALALRKHDRWYSFATFQGLVFPLSSGIRGFIFRQIEGWAATQFRKVDVLTSDDLSALKKFPTRSNVDLQQGFGFGCADRFLDTPIPSHLERMALRAKFGIPEDVVVWIYVGRLTAFKGFHLVVRGFWEAKRLMPNLHLVVVGDWDVIHKTGLGLGEVARYQSDQTITRAGWQEDVLPWLDLADVMIFPSEREGMPVCVMEALARKLPVVACRVRGCRELIKDGRNGYFLGERSVPGILELLVKSTLGDIDHRYKHTCESPLDIRRSRWVKEMWKSYLSFTL